MSIIDGWNKSTKVIFISIALTVIICLGIAIYFNSAPKPVPSTQNEAVSEKITYQDGSFYQGFAKNGVREGTGKLYNNKRNLLYQGSFKADKYSGKGILYYSDGHLRYQGDFVEGNPNGSGTIYNNDGTILYQGDFKDDKYSGKGILYYSDGHRYEGEFSEGNPAGSGTLYYADGSSETVPNQ